MLLTVPPAEQRPASQRLLLWAFCFPCRMGRAYNRRFGSAAAGARARERVDPLILPMSRKRLYRPRMNLMRRVSHRSLLACLVAAVFAAVIARPAVVRADEPQQQVATVQQLKVEAFKALKTGQFDRTNELLGQAAQLSRDPQDERMAGWIK